MNNIHQDVKGQSEDALQQKCYFWFHNNYQDLRGLLFHVPNGGARNKREAMKFKQIGLVPGVADLLFMFQGSVICFELKNSRGRQSDIQKGWQSKVEMQGFPYYIIRTLEEFKIVIKTIVE